MNSDSYPADGFSNLFNSLSTDGNVGPLITYMLLALVVSSICSVLEATILSTPITFINTLEQQGAKGAARLKKLKTDIDRPISAILIVNTIANTVGASLVGAEAAKLFQSTGVGVVSGLFTFLILVFSEIIPKTIGSNYWRNLAVPASAVIQGMIYITYPIVWLMEKFTHLLKDEMVCGITDRNYGSGNGFHWCRRRGAGKGGKQDDSESAETG